MTNSWKVLLSLLMAPAFCSGCAYMLKGTRDNMTVITDPAGADVVVNDRKEGPSPVSFTVPSNEDLHIRLSKDGYEPKKITSQPSFRWGYEVWSFLEFVFPMVIDLSYGAAWGHEPTTITKHLEPLPAAPGSSTARGSK
jgi:hypothetical protein